MRETVKIIIAGEVDHGKSTMIGRLLLDTNSLSKEKIAEIKKISKDLGKETELAYLTDQLKEEREAERTIDTTQAFFKTRKRNYAVIDSPGHLEFIKNMISGASLAKVALLIIDAREGVREQTRRHAYLVKLLGLNKVIVVFNKMDLVDYEKERFDEARDQILNFLGNLGIKPLFLVPVSARRGENIIRKSQRMSWHRGPTLLEALDSIPLSIETENRPLRLPIQDIYEIESKKIIVGRLASGIIKVGYRVTIFPSFRDAKIKSIEAFEKHKKSAQKGESIGLVFKEPVAVRRGEIIAQRENSPRPTDRFKGNIFWTSPESLRVNEAIILRCAGQEIEGVAERIENRIDSSTLEMMEEDAKELKTNETGSVILKTKKPIIVEKFSFIEELGRFTIERKHDLQGLGIVMETVVS